MADYENVCRFCLTTVSEFKVDIFRDESGRSLIDEVKAFVVKSKSWTQDLPNRPRHACVDCAEALSEVIRFHTKAAQSWDIMTRSVPIPPKKRQRRMASTKGLQFKPAADPIVIDDDEDEQPSSTSLQGEAVVGSSTVEQLELNTVEVDGIIETEELDCFGDLIEYVGEESDESDQWPLSDEEPDEPPVENRPRQSPDKDPGPEIIETTTSLVREDNFKPLSEEENNLEAIMVDMNLFECHLCGDDTETFYGLQKHIQRRHLETAAAYEICCRVRATVTPIILYDHIRMHLDKDAFKCQECGLKTTSSGGLKHHMVSAHADMEPKCICHVCGEGFMHNTDLTIHFEEKHEEGDA